MPLIIRVVIILLSLSGIKIEVYSASPTNEENIASQLLVELNNGMPSTSELLDIVGFVNQNIYGIKLDDSKFILEACNHILNSGHLGFFPWYLDDTPRNYVERKMFTSEWEIPVVRNLSDYGKLYSEYTRMLTRIVLQKEGEAKNLPYLIYNEAEILNQKDQRHHSQQLRILLQHTLAYWLFDPWVIRQFVEAKRGHSNSIEITYRTESQCGSYRGEALFGFVIVIRVTDKGIVLATSYPKNT